MGLSWSYCIFANNGLCITPNTNLISNIDLMKMQPHICFRYSFHLPVGSVNLPLNHPSIIVADYNSDWREFVTHIDTGICD